MTAVLEPTRTATILEHDLETDLDGQLHVARSGVRFFNVTDDRVRIEITVRNVGSMASQPTELTIQAAPLGAFVAWQPVTDAPVPALEPGESAVVAVEANAPRPQPLGDFDRVPPRKLLTAVGADDDRRADSDSADLPADAFDLLSRPNPHWAGNLNVFIGRKPVERHLAQALRIYPGRTNLAIFMVGTESDAYAFRLEGLGCEWETALYNASGWSSLVSGIKPGLSVAEHEWIETRGQGMFILAMQPPDDCHQGNVDVHVTQRSTGDEAIVEFSLDANAAGAGCYVV